MKNPITLLLVLTVLISLPSFAQSGAKKSHYVFPEFKKGSILFKASSFREEAVLNYNTYLQKMVVSLPNGTFVEVADTENIDTIYLQGKKFTPAGEGFYEVVQGTTLPIFIKHISRINQVSQVGYGNTSELSNTRSIGNVRESLGILYKNVLPDNYVVTVLSSVMFRKDQGYQAIDKPKDVFRLFPDKEQGIKKYIKDNKIDFNNTEDVERLILFSSK